MKTAFSYLLCSLAALVSATDLSIMPIEDPCATIRCGFGTACTVVDGLAQCVPPPKDPGCATVECKEGYQCKPTLGGCRGCPPVFECVPAGPEPVKEPVACRRGEVWMDNKCLPTGCTTCPDSTICVSHECKLRSCKPFTCEMNPCIAALCPVGTVCEAAPTSECSGLGDCHPLEAECVCAPYYTWDDFQQKCVPTSCEAPSACPKGDLCTEIYDQDCQGSCPYVSCQKGDEPVPPVCREHYEWDEYQNTCVPVSCEAPDACVGGICTPQNATCVSAPCPQFSCKIVDCLPFYEYDPDQDSCVPITCDAMNACPEDETCVPERRMCIRSPCQQFYCSKGETGSCPKGFVWDDFQQNCVAASCEAPDVCENGQVCIPVSSDGCMGSCPRVKCVMDPCIATTCEEGTICQATTEPDCAPFEDCGPLAAECVPAKPVDEEPDKCPENFVLDDFKQDCVPFTCDAPDVCEQGSVCVPNFDDCVGSCDFVMCIPDPCIATTCLVGMSCQVVPNPDCKGPGDCSPVMSQCVCPPGNEMDALTGLCVPVSCKAENACRPGETCAPMKVQCIRAPCPQYVCERE